jgi:cytochrome c551/c552
VIRSLVVLTLMLSASGAVEASEGLLPAQLDRGARVFGRIGCAQCHAAVGGEDGRGPTLARLDLQTPFAETAARMWNSMPGMLATLKRARLEIADANGEEMVDLLAFLSGGQRYLSGWTEAGDAARGRVSFDGAGCSLCHQPQELAALGPGRSAQAVAAAMLAHDTVAPTASSPLSTQDSADLLAWLASTQPPPEQVERQPPGDPRRGAQAFESLGCTLCHGRSGAAALGAIADRAQLLSVLWNHTVHTPGFELAAPADDSQLADLVAYLFLVEFEGAEADPARGQSVFADRGCANCHRAGALEGWEEGGAARKPAQFANQGELFAAMWRAAPAMAAAARATQISWPTLAPGEMPALIGYLLSKESLWLTHPSKEQP